MHNSQRMFWVSNNIRMRAQHDFFFYHFISVHYITMLIWSYDLLSVTGHICLSLLYYKDRITNNISLVMMTLFLLHCHSIRFEPETFLCKELFVKFIEPNLKGEINYQSWWSKLSAIVKYTSLLLKCMLLDWSKL